MWSRLIYLWGTLFIRKYCLYHSHFVANLHDALQYFVTLYNTLWRFIIFYNSLWCYIFFLWKLTKLYSPLKLFMMHCTTLYSVPLLFKLLWCFLQLFIVPYNYLSCSTPIYDSVQVFMTLKNFMMPYSFL